MPSTALHNPRDGASRALLRVASPVSDRIGVNWGPSDPTDLGGRGSSLTLTDEPPTSLGVSRVDDDLRHFRIRAFQTCVIAINVGAALRITGYLGYRPLRARLPAGGFGMLPPGQELECSWAQATRVELLSVYLPTHYLQEVAQSHAHKGAVVPMVPAVHAEPKPGLVHVAKAIVEALRETPSPDPVLIDCLARALAAQVSAAADSSSPGTVVSPGASPWRELEAITGFIYARLHEPLSLRAMAQVADLSVFHFARRFKQATGSTPHQYLIRARVGKAQTLLSAGSLSVADVAQETGFSSQSQFAHFFRRWVGCSPLEFRARMRVGTQPPDAVRNRWQVGARIVYAPTHSKR